MSEDNLVFHCAPTLAGIKSGSLFTCDCIDRRGLTEDLRSLNLRLGPKGLRVLPLRFSEKKALVYVYRPAALSKELGSSEAAAILRERGYSGGSADKSIMELMRRLNSGEDFPHEIGLFLSYPPEDVRGFMEKGGRDCKCVGTWKVYGDEEAARRTFTRYKSCTAAYCRRFRSGGSSLEQLAVSA